MKDYPSINHPADSQWDDRDRRRLKSRASTFRRDPAMERLLELEAKAEAGNVVAAAELSALHPENRMALGYYQAARSAAVEIGLVNAEGEPR